MNWEAWRPTYEAILADFGYDRRADEAARDALDALLADRLRAALPLFEGEVAVLGPAPGTVPATGPLVACDPRALPPRRPDLIVTDLDGDVALQVALNAVGVPLVVHAHGDNIDALRRHVPQMRGPVLGTCQCEPKGRVHNFGGFTDGDRACCLAVARGASSLRLVGFAFDAPVAKPGKDAAVKTRKLAWARRIIEELGMPATVE